MFKKTVDLKDRAEMIRFLREHFRYDTLRSWNRQTSYANNMKIYNLDLPESTKDRLYDMLSADEPYDRMEDLLQDFAERHAYAWQAGQNGRSGGYLVLYSGGRKKLEYKSRCTKCGQLNYTSTGETGCVCGRCGSPARQDLQSPLYQRFVSGKSIDADADFEEWSDEDLRERVELVSEFDQLCDDIVAEAAGLADEYDVEEEVYYVPQTRKVLVSKAAKA